jgi:mono/diheme cytochrome c family protein|tara:strand:+ start:58900 stop:59352 length:453 start_codon:yes stop_codon:yes gene_type:complete
MNRAGTLIVLSAGLLAVSAAAAGAAGSHMPGVARPDRAHSDYILKCQGCHRPDGGGDAVSNPPLNGMVAKFLTVPGGREFLGRVPGVASVNLSDERLADVLNWTLYKFDQANLPSDFQPYSAAEIGKLRAVPLRTERIALRQSLVDQMQE